jgi:hypothetical protein
MNIFYLDRDIDKCVQYHCDKHVVKMVTEYAQLLSTVHIGVPGAYKPTHINHPCAKWVRASINNYAYLLSLGFALGEEYTYRYNKTHTSALVMESLPIPVLPDNPFSEPPKCVHDDFKSVSDTVEAYRQFYIRDKAHFCVWSKRETPEWFLT